MNKNNTDDHPYEDEFELNIKDMISFFWNHKLTFTAFMFLACVAGVVVALLLPEKYTAEAVILPSQSSNKSSIISQIGQFVGNASAGGSELTELYPTIASSRTILTEVMKEKYGNTTFRDVLIEEYSIDKEKEETVINENILKQIRKKIQTNVSRKTLVFRLKITSKEPDVAAALVNTILSRMDIYIRFSLQDMAVKKAQMIEKRLTDISDSLKIAEDTLLVFKESNRSTNLSPKLQVTELRLLREVELNNTIYIELTKQLEIIRIQENQQNPVLNILDEARPPIIRSSPNRTRTVILFMIAGFVLTIIFIKSIPILKTIINKKDDV